MFSSSWLLDLGCPLLRGSFVLRLRKRAATDMVRHIQAMFKTFALNADTEWHSLVLLDSLKDFVIATSRSFEDSSNR